MTSSTSSSSLAAALVAVLAPAAIVAAALAWLGREDPAAADGALPPEVKLCTESVAKAKNGVVLVGNSKSGTDIDRPALARALGVGEIGKVGGPGSSAPLWYASLERCVYEEGHRPKLVVIYGTAGAMLRATLDSQLEAHFLEPYLSESEPVLERKVFGGEAVSPFWKRVRARKTERVLAFQHVVRDGVAGLFFAPPGDDGLLAAGRAYAEPALAKVLGEDAGDGVVTRHRAIPIAEVEQRVRTARDTSVDDTLIPDLVALARDNGSRIVFAQAPIAAHKVDVYDKADPALVREMVEALNGMGAGFLDLSTMGLPASAYGDGIHMNSNGRARLTAALADGLDQLDALGATPFSAAPLPRMPATVRREGAPPAGPEPTDLVRGPWDCGWQVTVKGFAGISDSALGRLGVGAVSPLVLSEDGVPLKAHATRDEFDLACAGAFNHQNNVVKFSPTGGPADVVPSRAYTVAISDAQPLLDPYGREAWWVYPGTTLRIDAGEGWEPALDGFAVHVETVVAIPGKRPATVSWGGHAAPVSADRTVGTATVPGPSPAGAFTVDIDSPPDGPWLLVRRVVAGTEAAPWYLLGTPDTGRVVELFKGEHSYTSAGLPDIGTLGRVFPARDGGFRFEAKGLRAPDAEVVGRVSGIQNCSPVRIAEDGAPLPGPNTLVRLLKETPGGYAHTPFGIVMSTADGTSPLENGRTYTAFLDTERACRSGRWLYPGDTGRFTVKAAVLKRLVRGATRLDLTGAAFGGEDPAAVLTARVFVGDALHFEGTVPLAGIDAAPPSWPLPAPVLPGEEDVTVELSVPANGPFTMVSALDLVEPPRPAFPKAASDDVTRGAGVVEATEAPAGR